MSLFSLFKTDEKLEKEGLWLEYGDDNGKPIRIKIARAGGHNLHFAKVMEQKTKAYRRQIQTETIDQKVLEKIFAEVYAETVVLDWENVTEEDGTPIPFNRDNCLRLFTQLPDLFTDIREQAQKSALFRAEVRETNSGN